MDIGSMVLKSGDTSPPSYGSYKPLRVMIVVYCLRGGGAERVASYLANSLAERNHHVSVVTEQGSETDQYPLRNDVERNVIGTRSGGGNIRKAMRMFGKILTLRRLIVKNKPDVVVSLMTRSNNIAISASIGLNCKTVICERNDPRHNNERSGDASFRKYLYPKADLIIAQTELMAKVVREDFRIKNAVVIPNPSIIDEKTTAEPGLILGNDFILGMGRLAPQKGFDVLIRAYARTQARKTMRLVLAGQGGHRTWYASIAHEEGVTDRVDFVGHLDEPFPVLKSCRMFVLSSRWEGFPNVLLEAMSFGRPVISTRLPSGAHDMIEDGVNGLLVPVGDHDALAAAIDRYALDREAAELIGARAPAAIERFRSPVVMQLWEDTLQKIVLHE